MKTLSVAAASLAALLISCASAQTRCNGTSLTGTVEDSTLALIPGASLTLDSAAAATSGPDGRFRFACVPGGNHVMSVTAPGFAAAKIDLTSPHPRTLAVTLQPEAVETQIAVDGEAADPSATSSGPSPTIAGKQLQAMADDPDDLLRELRQLAAATGANPANVVISVDGFQGTSKLPPKSSIAYIKVNPDQFSAEYREPPFEGGRVEVYTKPGLKNFHGALFATNGSPFENARDPFSVSKAAIGKQRYGFELTGPVRKSGSDFSLNLEHRSIDDFAVVNAITLDPAGNLTNTISNVATPQSLWIGLARLDWQLGAKNTLIASYSANVNHLDNVGVGGTTLAQSGYASDQYEHMFRLSNITTASANLMHESRLSLRWDGENDTPTSTAPQLQVAGAFTGGGATLGPQQTHELNIEADDDAILTTKRHTWKFGTQFMLYREREQLTTNFNGTYIFGGGTAPVLDASGQPIPGQTKIITGTEQYRRALLGQSGGTATAFTDVAGTPKVNFTQVNNALFAQDDWNVGHGVHLAYGLRYYLQNDPQLFNGLTPRAGILWSPGKKGTWTFHAHAGLFAARFGASTQAEVLREDGTDRVVSTIYGADLGNPFAAATPIHTVRSFAPGFGELLYAIENVGATHSLPHGWNLSSDFYLARLWNDARSVNINSPLNGQPYGPRPGARNLNLLQIQNSGQGHGSAQFVGVEQHSFKHVQFFLGGVHIDLVDDSNDDPLGSPQSAFTNAGEFAHRAGQPVWQVFGNGTFTLPRKVQLSTDLNAAGDNHYNITTGFDNNGDGNFNDRPQYAAPGTPGAIATRFGLLTSGNGIAVFPRNRGVLPWNVHLDSNLQRAFVMTHDPKADHQQTVTLNLRSSNLLNHTNVTQIGSVLGSPLFGVPYAADNGRRVEAGIRYSF